MSPNPAETHPTPSAIRIRVAGLVVEDGQILLAEHEKYGRRYWLLPGGGVEYGETLEKALKREFQEEAGVRITIGELLWVIESIPPDVHRHVINVVFRAQLHDKELKPTPDPVLRDVVWKPLSSLPDIELRPNLKTEILALENGTGEARIHLGPRWED